MAHYPLEGKVVLITGAGGGLGAATAAALAGRGARVVLTDIDLPAAQRTAASLPPGRGLALHCDVSRLDSVEDAVQRTLDEFGRLDVAIANAGVLGAYINGAGAIPYAMSKAAVEQLGRGLRVELAGHGASTMTAYFSVIDTEMTHRSLDADPHLQALLGASPDFLLRRIRPETAAGAIADGLQRRRTSITVPGRWRPLAALRGIAGPMFDRRLAGDTGVRDALAHLENR